jgi:hypothetical protein
MLPFRRLYSPTPFLRSTGSNASLLGLLTQRVSTGLYANRDESPASFGSGASVARPRVSLNLQPMLPSDTSPWFSGRSNGAGISVSARVAAAKRAAVKESLDKVESLQQMALTPKSTSSGRGNSSSGDSSGSSRSLKNIVVGETALARIEQSFAAFSKNTRMGVRHAVGIRTRAAEAASREGGSAVSRLATLVESARESALYIKLRPSEIAAIRAAVADGTVTASRARLPFVRTAARDPTSRTAALSEEASRLSDYFNRNRADLVESARNVAFNGNSVRVSDEQKGR